MSDVAEEKIHERQGSLLAGKERAQFVGRIAVLTAHLERYQKEWKALGYPPIPTPKLDEVRCAILAEGAVAELKRLQAELRIADEDLAERDRRIEQLLAEADRVRVSGAGVGTAGQSWRSPPDEDLEPQDQDPELLFEPGSPAPTTRATIIEAKPAEPEALDAVVHRVLVQRGSSASASFIAGVINGLGRPAMLAEVQAALDRLAAAGDVRPQDLGGIRTWRA